MWEPSYVPRNGRAVRPNKHDKGVLDVAQHPSGKRTRAVAVTATAAAILLATGPADAAFPSNAYQGPSSSATPYTFPASASDSATQVQSLITTPDTVPLAGGTAGQTWQFNGTPDGIGAFDNGDGTYTVLVNHEFGNTVGIARAHGSKGSYVSRLVIRKADSKVLSGEDLMKQVFLGTPGSTSTPAAAGAAAFSRFCSADLPAVTAFFNSASGKGTMARIFMNGEESGTEGRALGHVATGPDAGKSYELPALGKFAWENSVANPGSGDRTLVAGPDDNSNPGGEIYMYLGDKKATGATEVEKAGLTGGNLYGIAVAAPTSGGTVAVEDRTNALAGTAATAPVYSSTFTLFNTGDASGKTGTQLQVASDNNVTKFLRPEDFTWDADNPAIGYFQTTDRYDQVKDGVGTQVGRSRLWKIQFANLNNPVAGGTITALLDGTEAINMLDNLASSKGGKLILFEDVGGNAHNGKTWQYDVATDSLTLLLQHDPDRFGDLNKAATAPFNNDEENSGVVDISDLYGAPALSGEYYLFDDQAHYPIAGEAVEGGQLMLLHNGTQVPAAFTAAPGAVLPEFRLAAGLPIIALLTAGGVVMFRRRRQGAGLPA